MGAERGAANESWSQFYAEPVSLQRMLAWAATHGPLLDAVLPASSILEVGTGTGSLAGILSHRAAFTASIDLFAEVQRVAGVNAESLGAELRFARGDAFAMPFRDDAFDVAFSQGFFEHFDDDDVHRLIDEQLRVASRVVFSVPNRWYPHVGKRGPGLIGNERLMSSRSWRRWLSQFDADVTHYRDPKALSIAGVALSPPIHTLAVIER